MVEKTHIMDSLLKNINSNPMFRLSLGSKELFHSNFLEFLWDLDKCAFLEMLNGMLPKGKHLDVNELLKKDGLDIAREKENFDICIYHEERCGNKSTKLIYDVIIENKVKSIPYKEQLDKYKEKVCKNQDVTNHPVVYILLSLAAKFPNDEIIKNNWEIVSYATLAKAIPKSYNPKSSQYISDYVDFIDRLDKIKSELVFKDFEKSPFNNPDIIAKFHEIRISDLYIKLRGSYFICRLKEQLEALFPNRIDSIQVEFFSGADLERRRGDGEGETTKIWLSSGVSRTKSNINICINPAKSLNLYEIQIEGDQYRHMLNQRGLVSKKDSCEKQLLSIPFFKCENLPGSLFNDSGEPHEWEVGNKSTFNQYQPDVLYKYIKFNDKITVSEMLKIIVDDVSRVLTYLPKSEELANCLT